MKTLIISDIIDNAHSIIPYGLNIGKHSQTRVNVIHLIDPREEQGTYSPESDSHSVTPGQKLTQEQLLKKEETKARTLLDRLLSKEASRLNFPLRVDQTIEIRPVEQAFEEILNADPESLVITGIHPAPSMVDTLAELLKIIGPMNNPILIIPPEQRFVPPKEALLISDFQAYSEIFQGMLSWLKLFDLRINAFAITNPDKASEARSRGQQWKKDSEKEGEPTLINQAGVLEGDDAVKTLIDHVHHHKPDLVIIPKSNQSAFADYLYAGKHAGQFIEALGKPVLLY
ncbi:MAG: hypothetical protein R6U64_05410 [Bacteroidales bacterium]